MSNLIITTKDELETLIQTSFRKVIREQIKEPQIHKKEDNLLNIKEAAKFLKMAEQTLYGYTSKNLIPFIKRSRKVLFVKTDLEAWLMEGRRLSVDQIKEKLIKERKL